MAVAVTSLACVEGGGEWDDGGTPPVVDPGPGDPTTPPGGPAAPDGGSTAPDSGTPPSPPPSNPPPDAGAPPPPAFLREWVVSTSGSDSAAGTSAAPFRTVMRAVRLARPGDLIRVRAGVWAERVAIADSVVAGTADRPIRLQGEPGTKLIPQPGTPSSLIYISKPYWQVEGFEVDVQGQTKFAGVFVGDVTGSRLKGCHLYGGSLGAGVTTYGGARGALIEGNHIHNFSRGTEDSHGVMVQPTSRSIVIRGNVIHHNSGDSVQCIGPEGYSSDPPAVGVTIEDNTLYGDRENAVDIKTCDSVLIRGNTMRDHEATVVVHYSASNVRIANNAIYNSGKAIAIGGNHEGPVPYNVVVEGNRIWNITRATTAHEGVGIRLENSDRARIVNNTLYGVEAIGIRAGGGTGGNTSNLLVRNNIIHLLPGAYALSIGGYAPGLSSRSNMFSPGAAFSWISGGSRVSGTLSRFQAAGQETTSREGTAAVAPPAMVPDRTAVDWGENVGRAYCGAGPDIGAVETGCSSGRRVSAERSTPRRPSLWRRLLHWRPGKRHR